MSPAQSAMRVKTRPYPFIAEKPLQQRMFFRAGVAKLAAKTPTPLTAAINQLPKADPSKNSSTRTPAAAAPKKPTLKTADAVGQRAFKRTMKLIPIDAPKKTPETMAPGVPNPSVTNDTMSAKATQRQPKATPLRPLGLRKPSGTKPKPTKIRQTPHDSTDPARNPRIESKPASLINNLSTVKSNSTSSDKPTNEQTTPTPIRLFIV